MRRDSRSLAAPRFIVGVFLLLMGLAWTLDRFGVSPAHHVMRFWPAVLIALGLVTLLRGRRQGSITGLLLIVFGVWLLLNTLGVVMREPWEFIGPLLLVAVGAGIVMRGAGRSTLLTHPQAPVGSTAAAADGSEQGTEHATLFSVLGSSRRRWGQAVFRSAEATCIMGGCELDLHEALLPAVGIAQIEVFIIMGGLKLLVPPNWTVVTELVPFMGGVDDKTRTLSSANTQRLVIRGTVMMGGIEVSN